MFSGRNRDLNLQSFDDIPSASSLRHAATAGNSSRNSNSSSANSLPIPSHIRAASTPVNTEKSQSELIAQHKRYPSCVESPCRQNVSDPGFRKDTKKMSLDNFYSHSDDRQMKRASSETKEKLTKRNSSSPSAISLLSFTNEKLQKRSCDDLNRGKQQNNTSGSKHKGSLKATPELLAELLKGSSEKMAAAERHKKSIDNTNLLPTAVLQCLVSSTINLIDTIILFSH